MRIILFANGELPFPDQARALIRPDDFILCADGGAHHAMDLGLTPDRVVGDFDSLDSADLVRLTRDGAELDPYPRDKDYTDLELALQTAQRLQPEEVILLGALGGRLDQTLANIFLLAHSDYADLRVTLVNGPERAWIMRDALVVRGRPGDILSIIPLTPDVTGLTYHHGLRWTLTDAALPFGSSRGVSNELVAEEARLSLRTGIVLVIHRAANSHQ